MALQSLRNFFVTTLIISSFFSQSPRFHIEARTIRDAPPETTTESANQITTQRSQSMANDSDATENILRTTESTITTTASELHNEATTVAALSTESFSYSPTQSNRSLYEELRATSSFPTFSFETSSAFMKFDSMKMESESEEGRSDESIDEKFKKDKLGFMNNATKEEHHTIDEALFDGESIKYSSITFNKTAPEEDSETTAMPAVLTTLKKGKQLDMADREGENINASIPNAAEVWALAGMRKGDKKEENADNSDEVELINGLNNTAKNLLDWTEIAKMNKDSILQNSDDKEIVQTTVGNNIDDPATSENKDAAVIITTKADVSDSNGKEEFEIFNKTLAEEIEKQSNVSSKIFVTEKQEKSSLKSAEPNDTMTTELIDNSTTDSSEMRETTTTEVYETTTSIVDSFTVIGEDEDTDDIYKRTITESPLATVYEPTSTVSAIQTETMTNEISITQKHKLTKSTRAMTTIVPDSLDTTLTDNVFSTSDYSSKPASTQRVQFDSTISPTEIADGDKFKYGTLLPETTSTVSEFIGAATRGGLEGSTKKSIDSLNKESLDGEAAGSSNLTVIAASVSVAVLFVLAGIAFFVLKRRKQQKFSQRCRPVGLDAYSLDNVSVYNSVRRKANALRLSKRSYGNSAFEDPSLQSNVLDYQSLQDFTRNKTSIHDEFKEIPQVTVRADEIPDNCEDKNRYANVVPLPETRVHLQRLNDEEKSEYINANYIKGPRDSTNYYIATQAPLENTVADFWRMIWEQNSKVIVMATDLTENGVERCAEYMPASVVLDNSQTFGSFQVTLKSREVKGKYAVSQLHLKNLKTNTWREIMHLWYSWPENGCPVDELSVINLLLDARGYLKTNLPEQLDENSNSEAKSEVNDSDKLSTLDKTKSLQRIQGPLTVHCSPGTGRTGTLIACDIILRMLEAPPRQIDIPQIVYAVRRGRANAVRTKDQYEFIYNIANAYAIKLNTSHADS